MQAKGIWKQDPEANIWTQVGCGLGVESEELHSLYRSPNIFGVFILNKLFMKLYMGTAVSSIGTYIFIFKEQLI
jgi:hypothetical protein